MSDTKQPAPNRTLKVKYEETTARYASQFLANTSNEEIFLDLSSGAIVDPSSGGALLPIHTRLVLTRQGAQRLMSVLQQALQPKAGADAAGTKGGTVKTATSGARLPKLQD